MIRPSLSHRLLNLAQTLLILGGMAAIAWVVLSTFAGPETTLLIVALSLAGLALAPSLSRELLLRGYRARPLGPRDWPEGVAVLHELARRAGLPRPPELWYVPSQVPNAFAMGRPEESAVCVSDALLRLLTPRELAAVLAHEVAHIAHRDLWLMGLADAMSRAVSVASWLGQFLLILNLPLLAAGAATFPWGALLLLVFSPTIMALLQLSLSRRREYDADLGAALLTGDPEALASALTKLERLSGRFWEEIFLPGRRIPEPSLLRTHPPTEDRVARLRALAPQKRYPSPSIFCHSPPDGFPTPSRPRFHRYGLWF
ncbi:zinc metalloprotease HtpX [Paracoccus bogoriensis]|uniref:zinc metalloprotease HtpX n=1 Tax=Paracoccus bogoriensis TaxID=242065 RepID=UPI001FE6A331|nr:zinc metalloprotease HtpX [Paracoccus bogoriensis]